MQHEEAGAMMTLALPFPAVEGKGAVAGVGLQVSPLSSCQPCGTHPAGVVAGAATCSMPERGQMQEHRQKCINLPA